MSQPNIHYNDVTSAYKYEKYMIQVQKDVVISSKAVHVRQQYAPVGSRLHPSAE